MSEYNKEPALQQEIAEMLEKDKVVFEPSSKKDNVVSEGGVESAPLAEELPSYTPKNEWEEEALKIGWKPDHGGKTFIEAKEYVLRKPLFERIDKQNEELRKLKTIQSQTASHMAQVRKEGYEQALRDLEARQEVAVQDANVDEFKRLKAQSTALNAQMANDPIVHNQAIEPMKIPEVASFETRNGWWYNNNTPENQKMVMAADHVDKFLAESARMDGRTIDPVSHLAAVEAEVKRMFPNRFESSAPAVPSKPTAPAIGRSTAPRRDLEVQTDYISRLTPSQRAMGEKFQRDNPEFTLEVYAKELDAMGRLK